MPQKRRCCICVVFVFIFIIFCNALSADEIILDNGDWLTGTVITLEEETLTLETNYSEPIKIKKTKILSITTDFPKEIHLLNGEVLKGKLSTQKRGILIVESSDERDETAVDWERVVALNPPPAAPSQWKGNVSLGAGLQTGNTDRTNLSFGTAAERKTEQDRFGLRFLFHYAEENNEISARNTFGALKYDYFFTDNIYGYLGIELLNDKFKDLNLRTVVGPGAGYQIWDDPEKFLSVEAGISYFSEDLRDGEDDSWITARLAGDFSYTIKETIIIYDKLIVYPSLEKFGEYTLRNEAAVKTDLGLGWAFRVSNILERDSDPPDGVRKHDLQWSMGLQYDF
jgi:putative salt-induced outer membrane protein YdiY